LKLVKILSLRKISLISRMLGIFEIRNFTRKRMLVKFRISKNSYFYQ
jgi:hypothetical protein